MVDNIINLSLFGVSLLTMMKYSNKSGRALIRPTFIAYSCSLSFNTTVSIILGLFMSFYVFIVIRFYVIELVKVTNLSQKKEKLANQINVSLQVSIIISPSILDMNIQAFCQYRLSNALLLPYRYSILCN